MSTIKPLQNHESARNRKIRRDEATRRTVSSRSIMEYDKWVEGIKSGSNPRPGAWSSKILPNSKSMPADRDEELNWHDNRECPDIDRVASPELCNKTPADESFNFQHEGENACPDTRAREIAKYRKEMMEMVRGLPEEDFELTLQDIVEKRKEFKEEETGRVKGLESVERETRKKKNQKKLVRVARSKSIDTGLLTRMFKPLSVTVRRRSLNLSDRGENVTTKELKEGKKVIERKKSKDEEWWRKNEFSEKGSNSSSVGSSSSNGSHSSGDDHFSRNMSMKQPKCYCFSPGKSKAKSS